MNKSDDQHLWVSCDTDHRIIKKLVLERLCLRLAVPSGAVPGTWRLASGRRIFDVPLAIFSTSSYHEDGGYGVQ